MREARKPTARSSRRRAALTLVKRYAEMVLVMIVGMLVLGSALGLLAAAFGATPDVLTRDAPAVLLLGMGFSMAAPMVWWMRRRGHSGAANFEMAGAMILPTIVVSFCSRRVFSTMSKRFSESSTSRCFRRCSR